MIQSLANRVWNNERFQNAAAYVQRAWISREIKVQELAVDTEDLSRLMQAAAILACSEVEEHRRRAYQVATAAYELTGTAPLPVEQALRVVLGRLGNFPAFLTRSDVNNALPLLPLALIAEELSLADERRIFLRGKEVLLTGFQHALWMRLQKRQHVAISAPTSAGKSFILQGYLEKLFREHTNYTVVYLVPTRALISQVSRDLAYLFPSASSGGPMILTVPIESEVSPPPRAICVMTQERMQLMVAAHPEFGADVIILDEAQTIADGSRGILLQWVVDDLLRRHRKPQLLFASPGIRNLEVFGRIFGLEDIESVPSGEPTVAQNFLSVRVLSAKEGYISVGLLEPSCPEVKIAEIRLNHTLATKLDKLVHIPAGLGQGVANIIYANGADEAEKIALQLADLLHDRLCSPRREALAQLAMESVHSLYALAECVRKGVAFHYSNIPTQVRQAIEGAVADGEIDFLVCTSTLLQGVNLPVRNVFMCRPEKGRLQPLNAIDFWNLAGRAGRLLKEFQGNIFLIEYDEWKEKPLGKDRDSIMTPALEKALWIVKLNFSA